MKRTLDADLLRHDPFKPSFRNVLWPALEVAGFLATIAAGLLCIIVWAVILP